MTPTEKGKELIKGCGTKFGTVNEFTCGKESWGLKYCPICPGKISATISAWEDELGFLDKHFEVIRNARRNWAGLQILQYPVQERIADLREGIKILEGATA